MVDLLLYFARTSSLLVTGLLATIGSIGLGMGVMTMCTTTTTSCSTTNAVVIGGWVLQGLLFASALGLCLPPLTRRLGRPFLALLGLLVPVVAVTTFCGVSWLADHSYCGPGTEVSDPDNYCDVGP